MLFKLFTYKTPDSRASFSCANLFHKTQYSSYPSFYLTHASILFVSYAMCSTDTNELKTIVRLNYIFDDDVGFGRLACAIDACWVGFKLIS